MSERLNISHAITHAPAFSTPEHPFGGGEEAAREMAKNMYLHGNGGRLATLAYYNHGHRFNPDEYLPPELVSYARVYQNQRGLNLLTDDHTYTKIAQAEAAAFAGADAVITHYNIASEAAEGIVGVPVEFFFAHTFGRSARINNPARGTVDPYRDQIEADILKRVATGKMGLIIATREELHQLMDLYEISDPTERETLEKAAIITPLGVQPEYLELGRLQLENPQKRQRIRLEAQVNFIQKLKNDEKNPIAQDEAKKLDDSTENTNWMYVIGRLEAGKGHMEALLGFIKAYEMDPNLDTKLLMVGGPLEGKIYQEMMGIIEQLPDDLKNKIVILGNQVDADVIPASHTGIVASRRESFSLLGAKITASGSAFMLNGDAIIMEAMGLLEKDVDPKTLPLTFNPDNPEELAAHILLIVNNPELFHAQQARNAQYGKRFHWPTITANITAAIADRLSEPSSKTASTVV